MHKIERHRYEQPLSTVFGVSEKSAATNDPDEDDDPIMPSLCYLNYRYIRFCYHPLLDKFVLNSSWKDPNWTNIKKLRRGIEGEDKDLRSLVFGKNMIDIEEKTVMQLLLDEVNTLF